MVQFGNRWGLVNLGGDTPSQGFSLGDWGTPEGIGNIGMGLQGLSGLAGAYLGHKQYGLAKKSFNFNKSLANRNLANQGQLINNEMLERKKRALAGSAGLSSEERQQALEEVKSRFVDTSPIGGK